MKLNLKDEPKEWRKSTLLLIFGLALIASLLRWRHHLSGRIWLVTLVVLAGAVLAAVLQPRLFRGWHLLSMRAGFLISRTIGRVFLLLFFLFAIIPLNWLLRLGGKDLLRLRRTAAAETYWRPARPYGPLDRMF